MWFWWGNLRERDHLGDPDIDGCVISSIFKMWEMDCIELAQNRGKWQVIVNGVMIFGFPKMQVNS
jgi:hypothetical protein